LQSGSGTSPLFDLFRKAPGCQDKLKSQELLALYNALYNNKL